MTRDAKTVKIVDDGEVTGRQLDKRAVDDDDEDKSAAKKPKRKKKSGHAGPEQGDKTTTTGPNTGSPTTAGPNAGMSTSGKPDGKDASTSVKPESSSTTSKKGLGDNDDPDSSTMQNLMKNQRIEKKLLDKAYQALKDFVGFVETHDKMILNPVGASQMVSYVNTLVPKYLIKTQTKKEEASNDEDDFTAGALEFPRHQSKRYQFTRLGY